MSDGQEDALPWCARRFRKSAVPGPTLSGTRSWARTAETEQARRQMQLQGQRHDEAGELDGFS